MKYNKLTSDLVQAKRAAELAAIGEDKGPICIDTIAISLPNARSSKTLTAVKEAGLNTYGAQQWRGKRYFICPPKCGYRSSRKKAVQAMFEFMKNAGWDVLIHSQAESITER